MFDRELLCSTMDKVPCIRCRAKGIVLCPECQGTGDKRNASYVVVGRCHNCKKGFRGFITCPTCLGAKVVADGGFRMNYRLETERRRSAPGVWGFTIAEAPSRHHVALNLPPEPQIIHRLPGD